MCVVLGLWLSHSRARNNLWCAVGAPYHLCRQLTPAIVVVVFNVQIDIQCAWGLHDHRMVGAQPSAVHVEG